MTRTTFAAALALPFLFACAQPAPGGDPGGTNPPRTAPPAGQPAAGPPQTGQPASGQPSTGQPSTGQPATGQPSTGQPASGQPTLEFRMGGSGSSQGGEQGATAQGGSGQVTFSGTMSTPNPCYKLTGELDAAGRTLTVRVIGQANEEMMCIQSIGALGYSGTIRGVSPGTYTVRVVHTYPGTGWENATGVEAQVTVR